MRFIDKFSIYLFSLKKKGEIGSWDLSIIGYLPYYPRKTSKFNYD